MKPDFPLHTITQLLTTHHLIQSHLQYMWPLWWTKWLRDCSFSKHFSFPPSLSFHRCFILIHHRCFTVLATDSVDKYHRQLCICMSIVTDSLFSAKQVSSKFFSGWTSNSFVLLVYIVVLVLVVCLYPSSVHVVATYSGTVLFLLLCSVLPFFFV